MSPRLSKLSKPYGKNPAEDPIAAVRFEIQDADNAPEKQHFSDREIIYVLGNEGNHVLKAAAYLAEVLAARYAREARQTNSAKSVDNRTLFDHFTKLASRLRARAVTANSFIVPGATKAVGRALKSDSTLRQPKFAVGMHDNAGISTDSGDES